MTKDSLSTRRTFLKRGALLAAPIAATAAPALALADDGVHARARDLEDKAAIRELHQSWLRRVNTGECDALPASTVRRIIADHAGAADRIDVARDGQSAVGHFDCAVETATPLATDCTLAQMAHAQGHGTVRRTERRMLTVGYAKMGGSWRIGKVSFTPRFRSPAFVIESTSASRSLKVEPAISSEATRNTSRSC
jgi:hypothetical protein